MVEMKAKALGLDTLFQGIGLAYLVLFVIVMAIVLVRNKTSKDRIAGGLLTTALFFLPVYNVFFYESPDAKKNRLEREAAHERWRVGYEQGKAIFDEKCKTPGERIYRTVEGVEGILLPQIRRERGSESESTSNPMWPDAAFAEEENGNRYIRAFLLDRGSRSCCGPGTDLRRDFFESVGAQGERGFAYVEQVDDITGVRSRVTAQLVIRGPYNKSVELIRQPSLGAPPRYAVTIENNTDPALRKHWVAGSIVRVIDTATKTTLGELEVWRFDRSQGNTSQSMPWLTSTLTCPKPRPGEYNNQTHYFVERILKVKQGN